MTAQPHDAAAQSRTNKKMHRMLRVSGTMLILGLLIEAVSLHYNKALSFLAFMFIGGALLSSAPCSTCVAAFGRPA